MAAKLGIVIKRPLPYVGKLATVSDWHTQIARIFRRAASGELPEHLATKLTYCAVEGASLAKIMQELKELTQLREQLEAIRANGGNVLPFVNGGSQEYLPAETEGDHADE